jgi:hypothetical protein
MCYMPHPPNAPSVDHLKIIFGEPHTFCFSVIGNSNRAGMQTYEVGETLMSFNLRSFVFLVPIGRIKILL